MSISVPGCTIVKSTISSNGTTSGVADLEAYSKAALYIPALNTTPDLTFSASYEDDTTFALVKEDDGSSAAITIKGGAVAFVVGTDELRQLQALRFVKIVASVTQTADRVFYWILAA